MKRIFLAVSFAVAVFSAGCVAPPEKSVVTQSGKPELLIKAEVPAIKSALIGELTNYDYTIEQDTDYMLRMARPLSPGENFGASLAVGNAYSSNKRVTVATFVKDGERVRVIISSFWSANMPGGQTNTQELTNNGRVFNEFQAILQRVSEKVEKKS